MQKATVSQNLFLVTASFYFLVGKFEINETVERKENRGLNHIFEQVVWRHLGIDDKCAVHNHIAVAVDKACRCMAAAVVTVGHHEKVAFGMIVRKLGC